MALVTPHGWTAKISLIACAGASVLVGLGLGGRMPTAWAQANAQPAFPSQASVVTVDAVVVDAKGQSVEGLTKDDFRLEEDGQPQTLVNFEAVSVPAEAAAGDRSDPGSTLGRLLAICQRVVPDRQIGPEDNLLETNLNSLTLARLHEAMDQEFPHRIEVSDLFEHPTLALLARLLDAPSA
jgi:aryl carrier-like protein